MDMPRGGGAICARTFFLVGYNASTAARNASGARLHRNPGAGNTLLKICDATAVDQ
jgi:hypothetical protein